MNKIQETSNRVTQSTNFTCGTWGQKSRKSTKGSEWKCTYFLRRKEELPFPRIPPGPDALSFLLRGQSACLDPAGVREVTWMEKHRYSFVLFLNGNLRYFPEEQLRRASTFEVVCVDFDAADDSAVTETKHGPLPAGYLQDPPLVRLQEEETFEDTHSNCTFINVHKDNGDVSGQWEYILEIQDILESEDMFWSWEEFWKDDTFGKW